MHFSKALVVLFGAFAATQAYYPEEQVGKYNLHAAGPGWYASPHCLLEFEADRYKSNQNTTIARNLAIIGRCVNLHEEDAEYISVSRSGKVKWYWLGMCCYLVLISHLYKNIRRLHTKYFG